MSDVLASSRGFRHILKKGFAQENYVNKLVKCVFLIPFS